MLQPVETRADGGTRGVELIGLSRPGDLRDIADLGLTLPEAKRMLAHVQQAVAAVQARDRAAPRPECSGCGGRCRIKDWRSRRIATPFGEVAVRLPRFRRPSCGRGEAGIDWPSHCRSTPELDRPQARLSALMTYRVAAGVLAHLPPVAAKTSHETLRRHGIKVTSQRHRRCRSASASMEAAHVSTGAILEAVNASRIWRMKASTGADDVEWLQVWRGAGLLAPVDEHVGLLHLGHVSGLS